MRPFEINPQTGFLESVNIVSPDAFTSDKKLRFFSICNQYLQRDIYPEVRKICAALGINVTTFYYHLRHDERFKDTWAEIMLRAESMLTTDLAIKAKSSNGTLANLAMLRKIETGSWTGEYRSNPIKQDAQAKNVASELSGAIDAEIVPVDQPNQG